MREPEGSEVGLGVRPGKVELGGMRGVEGGLRVRTAEGWGVERETI